MIQLILGNLQMKLSTTKTPTLNFRVYNIDIFIHQFHLKKVSAIY